MTDRLREALETLAERTPPQDPDEFAARVLAPRAEPRRRWMLAAVAAAAVLVAAVALPTVLDNGTDRDDVVTMPTTLAPAPPVPQWQRVAIPIPPGTSVDLHAVAAAKERVVALGRSTSQSQSQSQQAASDAVGYVSVDGGLSWAPAEGLADAAGSESVTGVVAVDDGFVAVGSGDFAAMAWRSADGLRWTRTVELGGPHQQRIEAVTAARGRVVAVGTVSAGPGLVAAAWYSDDNGRSWRQATVATPDSNSAPTAVTATKSGYVMIGTAARAGAPYRTGAAWTSSDGERWSRVGDDVVAFPSGSDPYSIASGPDGVVAVGPNASVWASADGRAWTGVPQDEARFGRLVDDFHFVRRLGDGSWLAVGLAEVEPGGRPGVWSSPDGRRWEAVDDAVLATSTYAGASSITETADGTIVVVGSHHAGVGSPRTSHTEPAVWLRR